MPDVLLWSVAKLQAEKRKIRLVAQVIIINGPAGVGKSTICRVLSELSPGTIAISGDALRHFAPRDVRDHLGPGSTYRAGAALATAYLDMGATRIVFDYIFDSPEKLALFRSGLPAWVATHCFTLWAPLERVIEREARRDGRERLGDAVVTTFRALERNLHALGHVIANTETPEATARDIMQMVHGGPAGGLFQSGP